MIISHMLNNGLTEAKFHHFHPALKLIYLIIHIKKFIRI